MTQLRTKSGFLTIAKRDYSVLQAMKLRYLNGQVTQIIRKGRSVTSCFRMICIKS